MLNLVDDDVNMLRQFFCSYLNRHCKIKVFVAGVSIIHGSDVAATHAQNTLSLPADGVRPQLQPKLQTDNRTDAARNHLLNL